MAAERGRRRAMWIRVVQRGGRIWSWTFVMSAVAVLLAGVVRRRGVDIGLGMTLVLFAAMGLARQLADTPDAERG